MWPPRRSVGGVLWPQGSLYPEENRVKNLAQSELQISGKLRNGERPEIGDVKQKDRSNLGGAVAPPTPWEPRTRGETFLPSREEVKEEEEEGGPLSPLLSAAPERCRGPSSSPRSSPTTSPPSSPTLPPSMQWCNLSLTRCNLYLNMVLNAIYYSPNDVWLSYDV